jgi:hypothetical protein
VLWRRGLRLGALVALILVAYFVLPVDPRLHTDTVLRVVGIMVVLGLLAIGMTRLLRLHVEDEQRRVDELVLSIVVVVAVFAFAFYTLEYHNPGQVAGLHTRVDALYFTLTTLATIGYGDVHAVGQTARVLVAAQIVFDLVFVAAAASLLTHHLRAKSSSRD